MLSLVWPREPTCLTFYELHVRSFACLSNLKQSCSKFYEEQTLFRSQVMKMSRTCSKMAHKLVLRSIWKLRKISKSKTSFQFHWLDFGDDFTHDPLRIRSWSFNIKCSWYLGLQFVSWLISLITNGLEANHRQTSPLSRHWLTESPFQTCYSGDRFREQRLCGTTVAGRLSALPRAAGVLARPATTWTCLCACLTCSSALFTFPSPPPRAATEPQQLRHCRPSFALA